MDINGAGQPVIAFAEHSDDPEYIITEEYDRRRVRIITIDDSGSGLTAPVDIFAVLPEPGYAINAGMTDFALTCVDNKAFIFWGYRSDLYSSKVEWSYY